MVLDPRRMTEHTTHQTWPFCASDSQHYSPSPINHSRVRELPAVPCWRWISQIPETW
jgi:hypothetical protein